MGSGRSGTCLAARLRALVELTRIIDGAAIGPMVRVEISAKTRNRRGVAVAALEALDVETWEVFEHLRQADQDLRAHAAIATRKLLAIENLNIAAKLEEFDGSLGEWAARSPEGTKIMAAVIPIYLAESVPAYEELETLQRALHLAITHDEDKNPYEVTTHGKDCPESIWEDRANDVLVPLAAVKLCDACKSQRTLWATAIKKFGDSETLRTANRALDASSYLKQFRPAPSRVSVRTWEHAQLARAELQKRDRYFGWKAAQRARDAA